jgi:hypothetical protein
MLAKRTIKEREEREEREERKEISTSSSDFSSFKFYNKLTLAIKTTISDLFLLLLSAR